MRHLIEVVTGWHARGVGFRSLRESINTTTAGGRPSKLSVEQVRRPRSMYDARELTVERIGAVLRVSRTSIYRALGKTTTPAPAASAAPAPALMAEPMAATAEAAGDAPAELAARALARVRGAPVVVRSRSRRWFMVQANLADSERRCAASSTACRT